MGEYVLQCPFLAESLDWTIRLGHYGDSGQPESEQPNEFQFPIFLTTASPPLSGVARMIDMDQHRLKHQQQQQQARPLLTTTASLQLGELRSLLIDLSAVIAHMSSSIAGRDVLSRMILSLMRRDDAVQDPSAHQSENTGWAALGEAGIGDDRVTFASQPQPRSPAKIQQSWVGMASLGWPDSTCRARRVCWTLCHQWTPFAWPLLWKTRLEPPGSP
jgi:hypothetical protein